MYVLYHPEEETSMKYRSLLYAALAAICLAAHPLPLFAQADDYPKHPIHILVPFSPGGTPDVFARLLGQQLTKKWGQAVVVENRPGGNSIIASDAVAKAAPDGYTLLFTTGSFTINPAIYRKLPYDTLRDFAPVTQFYKSPGFVLVVNPKLPIHSVGDFIALGKQGKIAYGSPGVGNSLHLPGELLNVMAGTKLLHVPYKGASLALNAVIGGEIQAAFLTPSAALPVVQGNQVRAVAVTSATRVPIFPDVPTLAEGGVTGFDFNGGWNGIFAPANTPLAIVHKLASAVKEVLQDPELKARIAAEGGAPVGNTPEEFSAFIQRDTETFAKLVKAAGIEPQ
jgi:tripartite-type tricarboxylate transporter receptor subunit TctC